MQTLFAAKTKGSRYCIVVSEDNGAFKHEEFTHGHSSATGIRYTLEEIKTLTIQRINDAKKYDKINYIVTLDWQQ